MKQKVAALMAMTILMTLATAGCIGGSGTGTGTGTNPNLEEATGSIPTISGWAPVENTKVEAPINLQSSTVTSITVRVTAEDSNAENSETDEGSDPDDITVKITWGNITMKKGPLPTPASFEMEITIPEDADYEYLPPTGTVEISAKLNGNKPYGPVGFIVYVDQGFAYTLDVEYTYMAEKGSE